jgi:NhaA family Na+:H+ antiporter
MSVKSEARLFPPVGEQDHVQGNPGAPVVFVEYGDYECPHCSQAQSIIREVQERLGENLLYVFRHFPIRSSHPNAQKAAEAAEAASAQGKFWEMHNMLFEHQGRLAEDELVDCAREIGLDVERFRRELADGTYREIVEENFRNGVRSGVNGTPTFYINGVRYDGPWDVESLVEEIEKPLGVQVRNLFQRFTRMQAAGGVILFFSTLFALFMANSAYAESYFHFWETELSIHIGAWELSEDLLHWVNDGLMVMFFFVVGLEIKREITVGELASPRRAALPAIAALGGMLVPAAAYLALNAGGGHQSGWAVPMATDIAFSLGILTLLGSRVPIALKVFFTAMAIVDDIGAVLVIAIFYTEDIVWPALAVAGVILLVLLLLNLMKARNPLPYIVLGIGLWLAFLESGLHPTIAGVLLALMIPARSRSQGQAYEAQCIAILGEFPDAEAGEVMQTSDQQQAAAHALEAIAERMQTPAQRLEHSLTPWATFVVLPIFALANAGVTIRGSLIEALGNPVFLGIFLGLVIGKPLGVSFFSWIAIRSGLAQMPARVEWPQLISATLVAGIGFTMSIFIANSAFNGAEVLQLAKIAIIFSSVVAGISGFALLAATSHERDRMSEFVPAPAG